MPGLNLGARGGVRANVTLGNGTPTSATAAAFGNDGSTATGAPSTAAALTPNDPFGMAFWAGIGGFAVLFLIRRSLPR